MPDREKVIKAVEEAFDLVHSDFIGTDDFNETEWEQNKADALALLKEDCHNCKLECLLQRYDQLKEKYDKLLKDQEAVVQKTGHWIWLQFCANEGVYCSECHTKMFDRYPMKKKLSQFCGHCGAKMDDEEEGR